MEQNSPEWYKWRNQGIGSSDAPVIMQTSEWKTRHQLWEEKLGLSEDRPKSLFILEKGHETEKKARSLYEILHGVKAHPTIVVHDKFNFIRASLDGFVPSKNRVVEIKMQGEKHHQETQEGKVPERYIYQVMHQMLASNAQTCDFVSYCQDAEKKLAVVTVERNDAIIEELIHEEQKFWELVQTKQAPAFVDKDFKTVRVKGKTKEIRELAECYKELMKFKEEFKQKKKKFLEGLPDGRRLILDGHRMHKLTNDYRIEFKKEYEANTGLPILGEIWNDAVKLLPRIRGCNSNRSKYARQRWKESPDKAYWVEVIERIERSSFCTGKNNQAWKANFDFLIRPETHFKVMEGKYDDQVNADKSIDITKLLNE